MSFEVNTPNLDNINAYLSNEKNRSSSTGGSSIKWWSIPSGMSSVRILPPWNAKGMIAQTVFMHPIEYQAEGSKYKKYNWTCVQSTFGKPCKICEGLREMSQAGVDVSKWEPNRRQFYMNAIVMHDPIYQADIQSGKRPEDCNGVAPGTHVLMRAPKTIYDWVLSQITNPMVGDITSLENGIDIYITKEGTGLNTKYTPTLCPNGRMKVPQEYLDQIEALYDLDEIFSSGFDDDLINKLVAHLRSSAGMIQQNMPGVVANMAGYPQSTVPPIAPTSVPNVGVQSSQMVAPSPYVGNPAMATPQPQTPVIPNIPMSPVPPTPAPVAPAPTVSSAPAPAVDENTPKCFGRYDASNVSCVVCPYEIPCSQTSK